MPADQLLFLYYKEEKNIFFSIICQYFLRFPLRVVVLCYREGECAMSFWRPGAAGPGVEAERIADIEV
jgi:hypothetical protein